MEVVTPELKAFMEEQSEGIPPKLIDGEEWSKSTREMGGTLLMDIGPRGGGKTTKAVEEVQLYKEREPWVRRIANVPIENAYYVPNILKFLATKLIAEGGVKPYTFNDDGTVHIIERTTIPAKMFVVVDESAISGLEARGSGLYPLNTYLLALSRKINVDCELITQMMSMADKRAQWLSDFYCYCESFRRFGYFQYQYYDANYQRTQAYRTPLWFAQEYLFPKFDTTDIPNYDELAIAFRSQFNITDDDMQLYQDIKEGKKHITPESVQQEPHEIFRVFTSAFRGPMGRYPGETIILTEDEMGHPLLDSKGREVNKRYEVLQRDAIDGKRRYRYRLREIPELALQESAMDEGGLEPIEETQ